MRDSAYSSEAILFFENGQVSKEMTYLEFEAILDGVVGLEDFAGDDLSAAFVVVNPYLKVTGVALFLVSFDRQGYADRSWNLPLRHLVDTGGAGPDLGGGPIRLSCRSQCSVSWHASSMWDPDLSPKSNTFHRIRDVIVRNKLCLPVAELPVVDTSAPGNMDSSEKNEPSFQSALAGGVVPGEVVLTEADSGLTEAQLEALESEHRKKTASLIKQQRLHIQTLKSESENVLQATGLRYEKDKQLADLEISRLRSEHGSLHSQNLAIREQNEAQRKQIESLKQASELELSTARKSEKAEIELLRKQYEEATLQKVQEATAKLKEDIELRNMELMYRHDVAKQLREELTQLRKEKIRLMKDGSDKFLERLENLGVSFIAFHPGAGHVSISLDEMPSYMENPLANAAKKCMVSEEHYRQWLGHYQKPECQAPLSNDKICACRIRRVDNPSDFLVGKADRCEKHQSRALDEGAVNFST